MTKGFEKFLLIFTFSFMAIFLCVGIIQSTRLNFVKEEYEQALETKQEKEEIETYIISEEYNDSMNTLYGIGSDEDVIYK